MDANGQSFYMLADEDHWNLKGVPRPILYDTERRCLRLSCSGKAGEVLATTHSTLREAMNERLGRVPKARDEFGNVAFWDPANAQVNVTGAAPGSIPIFLPPDDESVTGMVVGYDDIFYLAVGGRLVLRDLRGRWDNAAVEPVGLNPWRLAANPAGGVWILDRENRQLALLRGQPLPKRPYGPYAADTFRPCPENPNPPELIKCSRAVWSAGEHPIAIACDAAGRVIVVNHRDNDAATMRWLDTDGQWSDSVTLEGLCYPYSVAPVGSDMVAVLNVETTGEESDFVVDSGAVEAHVYRLKASSESVLPIGDYYPVRDHEGDPFIATIGTPPHYPTKNGSAPLVALALPSFCRSGWADAKTGRLDAGTAGTDWHRLYLEASIPANCNIKVLVAASEKVVPPDNDLDWHEHLFGQVVANQPIDGAPRGAWVPFASEVPFHPGMTPYPPEENRTGLFTVLLQRANRAVKTLKGRYLHVRVKLTGDGRKTPELFALRAYAPRFSYLNRYLPRLYHESCFGEEADRVIPSDKPCGGTPADFMERFLDNFEGVLTQIEDRVAASWLVTDPMTAPQKALPWLGTWIGMTPESAYPETSQRRLLQNAAKLHRCHGTLKGLKLALNIATNNAVDSGEVIIIEDWRMRRTFATILGADLTDEGNPLLAGLSVSGNSYVGDTLFIGGEHKDEFLALYRDSVFETETKTESENVTDFLDRFANSVTILVHQEVKSQDLGLIRRVARSEIPAHVSLRVITATYSFIVGVASLVGVDTYLAEEDKPRAVRVGESHIGVRDMIRHRPALDPRMGGSHRINRPSAGPLADIQGPPTVGTTESFMLDGRDSRAAPGQSLIKFVWRWLE